MFRSQQIITHKVTLLLLKSRKKEGHEKVRTDGGIDCDTFGGTDGSTDGSIDGYVQQSCNQTRCAGYHQHNY